jgi:amino acid adenylation domain-containing protein/thioester reductase-like protein
MLESLELPTDRPRGVVRTTPFVALERAIGAAQTHSLRAAAAQRGLSLTDLALGAFHALLHRYSGQGAVVVGVVDASGERRTSHSEVAADTTLADLVRRSAAAAPCVTTVGVAAHQVTFAFAPAREAPSSIARELLATLHHDGRSELGLRIDYAPDLFDQDTIARMLAHWDALLQRAALRIDEKVSAIDFLSDAERREMLVTWNDTRTPAPLDDACVHHLFELQVERTPDAIAVVFGAARLTYRELDARADALARSLQELGVAPDTMVALCVERSLELTVSVLAILKAGGAYVPMDPAYPPDRLAFMLEDTRAPVLVTQRSVLAKLPRYGGRTVLLDAAANGDPRERAVCSTVSAKHLAYVIYTSGSTGRPKGICLGHAALVNLLRWHDRTLLRGARTLQFASLSFDASFHEMFAAWSSGGTVFLITEAIRRDVAALTRFVAQHAIEKAILPVVVLQQMAEHFGVTPELFRSLREVTTTGEQLQITAPMVRLFKQLPSCTFHNHYGPSETHVVTALTLPKDPETWPTHPSIGRPIDNTQLYILDRNGQPVPRGVPGELYIGGVSLARGYHGRADLTAERFVPDPFSADPSARLYKTGDLARWRLGGEVEFLGRIDDQVKIRGFRVELGEVEAALAQHPSVKQVAVLAREEAPGQRRLVAYVVQDRSGVLDAAGGAAPAAALLRDFLRTQLPDYMVPAAIVLIDAMPLTPNGKIDRRALPAPSAARPELRENYLAARGATEQALVEIWRGALGLERVGVLDNFFELGGDSLRAVQVFARVRERFGVDTSFQELFSRPTIAELAARIEAGNASPLPAIRRVDRTSLLPLSFAQERLWFLQRLAPESTAYHCPYFFRVRGSIDGAGLHTSLQALVARHEVLRTTFPEIEGRAFQRIHAALEVPLERADLAGLPRAEQESQLRAAIAERAARPFDLARGPLLRAGLIRLADDDHVFWLNLHHIITDGRSMEVVFRELAALYAAARTGRAPALAPNTLEYADYSAWQREQLTDERMRSLAAWWQERLRGAPTLLALPTDFPRPAVQSFHGASVDFGFGHDLTERLRTLGAQHNMTLVMVVLAGFAALLQRYSGQSELVIGIPSLGRDRVETEELLGFFVNTLPIRCGFADDPTFASLLEQVRARSLEAFEHDALPFERLVQELALQRVASYNPVVQVAIAPQPPGERDLRLSASAVEHLAVESYRAVFDLTLFSWETGDGFSGAIEYRTDLFQRATIERLIGHLVALLSAAAGQPKTPVSALPILTHAERSQLLVAWNDTSAPVRGDTCFHELFAEQAARTPDAVAVEEASGRALSYAALEARANRLARYLRELGVGRDALVALCVERSLDMVVGVLAIMKAGGAYVPLDPTYPRERLALMLADARPTALVTHSHLEGLLPSPAHTRVVRLDADAPAIERHKSEPLLALATAHDLAYVIFTSGSTGRPKGVMIEHHNLVNLAEAQRLALGMSADARVLQFSSLSFDAAVWEMATTLTIGATLCLLPPGRALVGIELGRFLQEHRISVATLPPSVLPSVPGELAASVRTLVVAGEACSAELVKEWAPGRRFINAYGPTECTVCATLTVCSPDDAPPSIGRPLANVRAYVLDDAGGPVPVGVPGELFVGGEGVGRGYLHQPDLTRERFRPDPFSARPNGRLYRTGDQVRYRPDGQLEFLGRRDLQLKLRGYRIETGEIEAALRQHPDLRDAVVVAREDAAGDRRLVGYVVPAACAAETAEHVSNWRTLYDKIYEGVTPGAEPDAIFTGWNSSFTGQPIPHDQMRAWRARTVERILSLRPTEILEIGCGTGLLLLPLAPQCASYVGTDISQRELALLGPVVEERGLGHVKLELRRADDFEGVAPASVDTVVVNSVIQYFPDASYLRRVLAGAVRAVRPGGRVFVGDVRSLPLLEAFRASIELTRAASDARASALHASVQRALATEPELLVDPEFFRQAQREHPAITNVEVVLKRGRNDNELESYRYDVVLHVGAVTERIAVEASCSFADVGGSVAALERWLRDRGAETAEVLAVPNSRVRKGLRAAEWMATCDETVTEFEARWGGREETSVHPEDLWELGERLGYAARVTWSRSAGPGALDVLFERPRPGPRGVWMPGAEPARTEHAPVTNEPMLRLIERSLPAKVREFLEQKLPSYMVPADFVVLNALPLSPTGKVDRKALPSPAAARTAPDSAFVAPSSPTEQRIAAIWSELLGVARVGVHDDFFALGGHSLMVSRVIFRIQSALGIDVPMRAMYEAPTIAEMCRFLEQAAVEPGFERLCFTPTLALEEEARLDEVIRPDASALAATHAKEIFLTGATGFVGAHLLAELLARGDARLHCLVRARSLEDAMERLLANLRRYGASTKNVGERVQVVLGDLGAQRLSLTAAAFERLAARVDTIVHNGAKVDHVRGYAHMKPANVLGTHEILRLACSGPLKPVHFVSTLGVVYPPEYAKSGVVRESAVAGPLGRLPNGYMQSKCVAEHLVTAAMARGVPAAIYRLGAVAGHSATGACNAGDFTYSALRSTIELGFADDLDTDLTLTPVDFVARALAALIGRAESLGRVHHVTNPSPFSWLELVRGLKQRGFRIRVTSYAECMQGLLDAARRGLDTPMLAFLPFLTQKLPGATRYVNEDYYAPVRWDCENLLEGLTRAGVEAPAHPERILDAYLEYLAQNGLLARATDASKAY